MKKQEKREPVKRSHPAMTPESRENQLISLAVDVVEERLRNGTATSQEIVHFLKLGSTKERIEKEILEKQKILIEAKTEHLQSTKHVEELYAKALDSMRRYSGYQGDDDDY